MAGPKGGWVEGRGRKAWAGVHKPEIFRDSSGVRCRRSGLDSTGSAGRKRGPEARAGSAGRKRGAPGAAAARKNPLGRSRCGKSRSEKAACKELLRKCMACAWGWPGELCAPAGWGRAAPEERPSLSQATKN